MEDESGIAGAPRDETSFEYDVEVSEDDPAPLLDGVPLPSRSVVRALQPYLETRRAKLAAVTADSSRVLVLTRLSESTHVHLVEQPLAMRRQLTFGREPIEQAAFIPGGGRALAYRGDVGGHEDHQIFRLDLESRQTTLLSDGKSRHGPFRWSAGGRLAFTSNMRNGRDMDLYVLEVGTSEPRRVVAVEGQWVALSWSRDGRRLLTQEFRAIDDSTVHIVDVETGTTEPLAPLEKGSAIKNAAFAADGARVYVVSNRDRDAHGVFEIDLATRAWKALTPTLPWDVEEIALSSDGRSLAYVVNEDGTSTLWLRDLTSGGVRRLESTPRGVVSGIRFVGKGRTLAFTSTTATRPADVVLLDTARDRTVSWTESEVGGIHPKRFVEPELVRVKSFDGLEIPAFLYRPWGKGPFPVLLWMHGGPEDQSRPAFDPIVQYFATARGVAVLAPNVRGSDGYGKRFLALDDGVQRHKAVEDVGALLDWIAVRSDLDAERVGIHGASYGGFMVLAALATYPDRIRAGCDVVGMSNLVTFLENTRDYRRDLRRAEYGDEREAEMRAYLEEISPLGRVNRIRSALLVAHGENDPRVPLSEAEQVVNGVRDNGVEAWFFVARSEGHSFRKRRNRDAFYRTMADFFERYLLRAEPVTRRAVEEEADAGSTDQVPERLGGVDGNDGSIAPVGL